MSFDHVQLQGNNTISSFQSRKWSGGMFILVNFIILSSQMFAAQVLITTQKDKPNLQSAGFTSWSL